MAAVNILEEVTPKLLAQGLMALRYNAIMPQLVNRDYQGMAAQKGATIVIPLPPFIPIQDVEPSANNPSTGSVQPTSVQVPLDQWKEVPFFLTDRDLLSVQDGTIPMLASEAISSLADEIDQYIFRQMRAGFGNTSRSAFATAQADGDIRGLSQIIGTAGQALFSDDHATPDLRGTKSAIALNRALSEQKAPKMDRCAVVSPEVEAAALGLRAFQDISWMGSGVGILEGNVDRKFGLAWLMDQNAPTFTPTTFDGAVTVRPVPAANVQEVTTWIEKRGGHLENINEHVGQSGQHFVALGSDDVDDFSTAKFEKGAVITFAGDTDPRGGGPTRYSIEDSGTFGAGANLAVRVVIVRLGAPLRKSLPATTTVTKVTGTGAAGKWNFAFHKSAFVFASRPLEQVPTDGLGTRISSMTDPVSGISLRLEVTRENKRTRFSYDCLYGGRVVRPELGVAAIG